MGDARRPLEVVKWRADTEKSTVCGNFEKRGWVHTDEDDWNVYWANSVRQFFGPDSFYRLTDWQLLNHFPNHYELTRKDLLVKNYNRYKREVEKNGGNSKDIDFIPVSYALPSDYMLFQEEFRRRPNSLWIMKPASKARGVGIFMVHKLAQVKQWAQSKGNSQLAGKDVYVVSQYIERPLLIGGRKFDLRLYVLVTSYQPLTCYKYALGFARFCTAKYTTSVAGLENRYAHLTNVSIQQKSDDYNEEHGGKWTIKNLKLYLQATVGQAATEKLWKQMDSVITTSLYACQPVILNDKHCYECYGYDILIDGALKPWLIEVNASPSLSATTSADFILKSSLIDDVLKIVCPPGFPNVNKSNVGPSAWRSGLFSPLLEGGRPVDPSTYGDGGGGA